MSYLVNLGLDGRQVVVVGAGTVALRKITTLLDARANVVVIAPRVCDAVAQLAETGRLRVDRRRYEDGDLAGAFLVIAATDDESVNGRISRDAQAMGVLVNVVDRPALCTFTLPAVVRRGDLTLAVATEGQCPAFARALREELQARYGPEYGAALAVLAGARRRLVAAGWDSARVQRTLAALVGAGLVEAVAAGNEARVKELVAELLSEVAAPS